MSPNVPVYHWELLHLSPIRFVDVYVTGSDMPPILCKISVILYMSLWPISCEGCHFSRTLLPGDDVVWYSVRNCNNMK